jgi:hypothetical protein
MGVSRERSQKENVLEIDRGVAISKSSARIFGFLVWAVGLTLGRSFRAVGRWVGVRVVWVGKPY